ncbi:MAG: DnaK suppressor protein [Syntrophaceae bacterium]|nr:MAG: DnaK suppressor protein [Syntrophaceae bacterium]
MVRQQKIESIRNKLVRKMEELWSNAGHTLSKMKNDDGRFADPFDQAAIESNKYVELACRDRERELMLDIKETILRIDRGLYGICDHCGRVIHEKRLLIEPMSKLCMECQKEKERNHKRKNRQWAMKDISYNHV